MAKKKEVWKVSEEWEPRVQRIADVSATVCRGRAGVEVGADGEETGNSV